MTAGCSQQAIIGPLTSWVVGQQIKVQDRKTWKQNELVWSRLLTEATNWYSFVQERKKTERERESSMEVKKLSSSSSSKKSLDSEGTWLYLHCGSKSKGSRNS